MSDVRYRTSYITHRTYLAAEFVKFIKLLKFVKEVGPIRDPLAELCSCSNFMNFTNFKNSPFFTISLLAISLFLLRDTKSHKIFSHYPAEPSRISSV